MARFGIGQADVFLPEREILKRYTPEGHLAEDVRAASRAAAEGLAAVEGTVLALDATLERPLAKTGDTVARAFDTFAEKVAAAEARVRGFAPERLKRLAAWARPGGRPQERVFSFLALAASAREDFVGRLLEEIDVLDHRHQIIHLAEGA